MIYIKENNSKYINSNRSQYNNLVNINKYGLNIRIYLSHYAHVGITVTALIILYSSFYMITRNLNNTMNLLILIL